MPGGERPCLRCGGAVTGEHPAAKRGICGDCARTVPVLTATTGTTGGAPAAAASPFLPEPGTDLGGLVVEGMLGSGGMGSVLAARDVGLDRRVAVKFLREGQADPAFRRDFRAEGAALARIAHPHVVRVFQVGEWHGVPFLVMELVEGTPLARALDAGPLPIAEALRIASQLASALAAVHAARVVHRDVNPSNCLLRGADRSVCLVDFGLARRMDRLSGTSGRIAGTPHYMAPEQISGRMTDERSDVYAFGVTLFEMLAGAPPMEETQMHAFFHRVLHEDAPLLRTKRPDAPREVEVLVARALSRFPEFRPANGGALVERLREIAAGGGRVPDRVAEGAAAAPAPAADPPAAPPRDVTEALPLLGRQEEYRAALADLDAAAAGDGRLLLMEGPAGAGKTRFLAEVEKAARARAMGVLHVPATEYAGAPLRALRAGFLEGGPAADLEAGVLRASPANQALLPALRWFLAEGREADPPPGRTALRGAVLALLRSLLAERPLLLAVEDAHLLDEGSLELLAAVAEEGRSWPLLLAVSCRTPDDPRRGPALEGWIPRVAALAHARALRLPPLSEAAVAALLHRALHIPEAEACRLAPALHRKSNGNPLFLVESLRVLEQEGRGADPAGGRRRGRRIQEKVSTLTIPPRLLELAVRRVAGLPPAERDALGVVAVDPLGVPSVLVERCLEQPRLTTLRVLQHLVQDRGLLQQRGDRYFIPHGEIREAVYGDLLEELRAGYHDEAARVLLESGAAATEPGRVGRHLRLAGRPADALPHLLRDGERLLRCFAPAEALERFEEAGACAPGKSSPPAAIGKSRALADLGQFDAARRVLEAASADGSPAALLAFASFERDRGQNRAAMELFQRVPAARCEPEQRVPHALLGAQLHALLNENERALEFLQAAFDASPDPPRAQALTLWATRGTTCWRLGRFAEAREALAVALRHAEEGGDLQAMAMVLHNLSLVCVDLGDCDEAGNCAERAVGLAALMDSERSLVYAKLDLIDVRLRQRRLEEAAAILETVTEPIERAGDLQARSCAAARSAELALARGVPAVALDAAVRGQELALDSPAHVAGFLALRARALLALDRAAEALAIARDARRAYAAIEDGRGEEEAAALAAWALRRAGADGPEREAFRGPGEALTVDGAVERALEAKEPEEARRRARCARGMARDPWAAAEVEARLPPA